MQHSAARIASQIVLRVRSSAPEKQMSVLQDAIAELPAQHQQVVSAFVVAAFQVRESEEHQLSDGRHRREAVSNLMKWICATAIIFALVGLAVIYISGSEANSQINIAGWTVETENVGVAVIALAVMMIMYVVGKSLGSMR